MLCICYCTHQKSNFSSLGFLLKRTILKQTHFDFITAALKTKNENFYWNALMRCEEQVVLKSRLASTLGYTRLQGALQDAEQMQAALTDPSLCWTGLCLHRWRHTGETGTNEPGWGRWRWPRSIQAQCWPEGPSKEHLRQRKYSKNCFWILIILQRQIDSSAKSFWH